MSRARLKRREFNTLERGQTLALFVFALVALMGLVALTVDVGLAFVTRREMQNAVDSAVLAGAARLAEGAPPSVAAAEAREWAEKNGYSDGVEVVTPYNGDPDQIQVSITADIPFAFGRALGMDEATMGASAVAESTHSGDGYAIIALNETACHAYDYSGSGNVTITGGGIMVNSDCSHGFRKSGSGDVTADVIHYFGDGGYSISGSGDVTPTPSPVGSRVEDPLAGLAPPTPGDPAPGSAGTAEKPKLTHLKGRDNKVLNPGTYYGGIKVSGSGNVTFQPGVYVIAGGGLNLGSSGNKIGTDVMFYNTKDPDHPTGAGAYGRYYKISGSGNIEFSAPSSGPYTQMLFWQDPGNTHDADKRGSGNLTQGIIYLPTAKLDESGSGNLGTVQIIVDRYDKSGSGDVEMTSGGWVGDSSDPAVRIVE